MRRSSQCQRWLQVHNRLRCKTGKGVLLQSITDSYERAENGVDKLTSFTNATHLTCMRFLSRASCSNLTTSFPVAFLAEKPFVQVNNIPESKAFCSTGKENVRPRCKVSVAELEGGEGRGEVEVRKAATESARKSEEMISI